MTLIVAEIGVNWNGDFSVAKEMIHEAKKAGADLVKFQSFNEKLIKNHPEKKRLIKLKPTGEGFQGRSSIINYLGPERKLTDF